MRLDEETYNDKMHTDKSYCYVIFLSQNHVCSGCSWTACPTTWGGTYIYVFIQIVLRAKTKPNGEDRESAKQVLINHWQIKYKWNSGHCPFHKYPWEMYFL